MEIILSLLIGIGLSAATGFRIFIPALLANIAAMNGWVDLGENFQWLSTWSAFWVLISASVLEIGAYYIPFIDNILDAIAAPMAVIAGTILSTSFIQIDQPVLQWGLGVIMGGGTAGAIQVGTQVARLTSTGTTAGISNPILATIENILSFIISLISIFIPVMALMVVILIIYWLAKRRNKRVLTASTQSHSPEY